MANHHHRQQWSMEQPPDGGRPYPPPSFPQADRSGPSFPRGPGGGGHDSPAPAMPSHPPAYPQMNQPPPSGYRVPLAPGQPFPQSTAGEPPFRDLDGSPVFLGSALFQNPDSVHPCKIAPGLNPPARVPYGGGEHEHQGRYDLLPFDPQHMEWVPTSGGRLPQGRRPVEGGYEQNGGQLYHAYANIQGVNVPGKTGEHLGGANIAFGGGEHSVSENYFVLMWK